jgi:hypothetical protein
MTMRNGTQAIDERTRGASQPKAEAGARDALPATSAEHEPAPITARLPKTEQLATLARNIQGDVSKLLRENRALVPVATGALGLGAGVLVGSRLARALLLVGAGVALGEFVRSGGLDKLSELVERKA